MASCYAQQRSHVTCPPQGVPFAGRRAGSQIAICELLHGPSIASTHPARLGSVLHRTGVRSLCPSPHAGGPSNGDLAALLGSLEAPEVDEDLGSYQSANGAVFGDDGVPTTFGNDGAALQAFQRSVAIVDRSNWGRLRVTGRDRLSFLHGQSTADVTKLAEGQGCDTVFVTAQARCIDLATCLAQNTGAMLILSPGMKEEIKQRLEKYIFPADQVEVHDLTASTVMLSVAGPDAHELVEKLQASEIVGTCPGSHVVFGMNGQPVVAVAGAGLPGPGYTFISSPEVGAELWRAFTVLGAVPMGTTSWEVARVVAGRPVPGRELTEEYNPLEAGLYAAVSINKGCYMGQETLSKVHGQGALRRELSGLLLEAPVSIGDDVFAAQTSQSLIDGETLSKPLGKITSFVDRPVTTSRGSDVEHRALAYLRCRGKDGKRMDLEGMEVCIGGIKGKVVCLPFATRVFPDGAAPVAEGAAAAARKQKELEDAAEIERKTAKLAEMQARIAAWHAQNASSQ